MKLKYEIMMDDLIAFQEYHCRNSKTIQRQISKNRLIGAIAVPFMTFLIGRFLEPDATYLFVFTGVVTGLYMYWRYPAIYRKRLIRNLTKMNAEQETGRLLGNYELEIQPECLFAISSNGEGKSFWKTVGPVAETEVHYFVFVTPLSAHVIPKRHFPAEVLGPFISELNRRIDEAKAAGAPK